MAFECLNGVENPRGLDVKLMEYDEEHIGSSKILWLDFIFYSTVRVAMIMILLLFMKLCHPFFVLGKFEFKIHFAILVNS